MARTDKDQRCHCPRRWVECPHCGARCSDADHRSRCHRQALGLKPHQAVARRLEHLRGEWRGGKKRLRRLARRKGKVRA